MSFELERVLYETEDFLRRAIGSPTRRAAKRRRAQRKWEEFGRRARRSGFIVAGLMVVLLGFSLFKPGLFFAWIFAVPVILFLGIVLMFQPTRHARKMEEEARLTPHTLPLPELAVRAEEGLLDRCDELPGRALPAADRIMAGLREIQPHLHELGPNDEALAGDIRRLIGQHLPQLVDSYLALPDQARASNAESSRRFVESLDIVAGEMDHLLEQCCRDRQSHFDTHSRFIETRYREDDNLRGS
ncbi:MAG TPA: hypothetical protein VEC11_05465 [Allosphingosinicella sp.]|nr:hypothetical protein [Allosphingosinicella sp.]